MPFDLSHIEMPRTRFLLAGLAILIAIALLPGRLWAQLPAGVELQDMTWVEVRAVV